MLYNDFKFKMVTLFGKDEFAQNRKNIAISNFSATTTNNLIAGNFLTGLLLLMNADDAFIGMVTIVTFLANITQILSPLLLENFLSRKKILVLSRGIFYFINIIIIGLIPYLHIENKWKLTITLIMFLIINFINALLLPGYPVWHIKSIPENIRTTYFSFFTVSNGIIVFTLIFASGKIVDYFKTSGDELLGLTLIRILALVFGAVDIYFLSRIKEYPNIRSENRLNFKNVIITPFREKKYLMTVLIACLWTFSASIIGPYFNIYLLKDLKVEYSFLNLVGIMQLPTLIILTPFWANQIGRTSNFKVLTLGMWVVAIHYVGLIFVTKNQLFIFPLSVFAFYLFAPGIGLVMANIPFMNIPLQNQTNFIGFFSAMNNLAAFTGAMLGNLFIRITENTKITFYGITLLNRQYIVLFGCFMMICAILLIKRLSKNVNN